MQTTTNRKRHTDKDIEAALRYAESYGWHIRQGGHHAWGKMYCPTNASDCRCGEFCITHIWSTPKSAHNHACLIRRVVEHCNRVRTLH